LLKQKQDYTSIINLTEIQSLTIKRTIVVRENHNKQVKFLAMGPELAHCFMVSIFQNPFYMLRTTTDRSQQWLKSKVLCKNTKSNV
jgi:hypothetical protein